MNIEIDKKHIAKIIQDARKKAGLKQSELAEKINISEKHLSKIETGKNYPALDTFLRIINVLHLSLGDFGIASDEKTNSSKVFLQDIINNSSNKQLNMYIDLITTLKKHF